jgi:hypothetical protein
LRLRPISQAGGVAPAVCARDGELLRSRKLRRPRLAALAVALIGAVMIRAIAGAVRECL